MVHQKQMLAAVFTAVVITGLCTVLGLADTTLRSTRETKVELSCDYNVKPVSFSRVRIEDNFWTPRLETSRKVTIPYAFKKCEETGRIRNFEKAAGLMEGKHEGIYFNDSDVYKVMEGAVAHYQVTGDKAFLDIATKNADLLCDVFADGKRTDPLTE